MNEQNDGGDGGGAAAAGNGELSRATWPSRDAGQAHDDGATAAELPPIDLQRVTQLVLAIGVTAAAVAAVVVLARAIKTPIVVRHV